MATHIVHYIRKREFRAAAKTWPAHVSIIENIGLHGRLVLLADEHRKLISAYECSVEQADVLTRFLAMMYDLAE